MGAAGLLGPGAVVACLENTASVQFNHRLLATVTAVAIIANWFSLRRRPVAARARRWAALAAAGRWPIHPWRGGDFVGRAGRSRRPSPIDGGGPVRGHGDDGSWPCPTRAAERRARASITPTGRRRMTICSPAPPRGRNARPPPPHAGDRRGSTVRRRSCGANSATPRRCR